ncbi:hypothetical protein ABZP36_018191 [Zizania latifolia]
MWGRRKAFHLSILACNHESSFQSTEQEEDDTPERCKLAVAESTRQQYATAVSTGFGSPCHVTHASYCSRSGRVDPRARGLVAASTLQLWYQPAARPPLHAHADRGLSTQGNAVFGGSRDQRQSTSARLARMKPLRAREDTGNVVNGGTPATLMGSAKFHAVSVRFGGTWMGMTQPRRP